MGKEFSIVTQNTSLLVLDRVEDYVQYGITPPAELQKEYVALMKETQNEKEEARKTSFDEALQAMEDIKAWWNKKPDGGRKAKKPVFGDDVSSQEIAIDRGTATIVADCVVTSNFSVSSQTLSGAAEEGFISPPPPRAPPPPQLETAKFTLPVIKKDDEITKEETVFSEITLKEWKPDAGYLKVLDKTAAQNRWTEYIKLKSAYGSRPSFFIDVATWFLAKGQKDTALLILSNIAEMKLEDAELLRSMAYRLLDMNEKELAVETFREVLKMREEEPQAYRDLALALNETGNHKEAVAGLYKVITGVWDNRFTGIKSIALNEMNSILSAHPGEADISDIDARFIYAMPVDVRIIIDWNTNDSDIDLWVTDPKGEKCFYQNKETGLGGHISDDMTQGYGPEEFAIKKAAAGGYVIEANLYGDTRQTIGGPVTIRADLYTDFGKPTQQRKTINFRVTDKKEVVKIGELKFG